MMKLAEPWLGIASDLAVVLIDSDFLPAMLSGQRREAGICDRLHVSDETEV